MYLLVHSVYLHWDDVTLPQSTASARRWPRAHKNLPVLEPNFNLLCQCCYKLELCFYNLEKNL